MISWGQMTHSQIRMSQQLGQFSREKYGNVPSTYKGYHYDSKAEVQYAMYLDSELQAGRIRAWEKQVTIPIYFNDLHVCDYRLDFKVEHLDDTIEWVEVKGFPTPTWALKRKVFEAGYLVDRPDERYTVVTADLNVKKMRRLRRKKY